MHVIVTFLYSHTIKKCDNLPEHTEALENVQDGDLMFATYIENRNIDLNYALKIRTRSPGKAGNINLQAIGTFQAKGAQSFSNPLILPIVAGMNTLSFADGDSGNIYITAEHISLDAGGQIDATSVGTGKGGNLFVRVSTI